jgi:hypothetical protein
MQALQLSDSIDVQNMLLLLVQGITAADALE